MTTVRPRLAIELEYEEAAQRYQRSLPLEHYMEATPQSTQRLITSASLELVHAQRPEIQYFNELLVQYPVGGRRKIGQVVPDTMVIVHAEPLHPVGSYNLPLQPARPFWMLEYVSKSNKRKDYEDNLHKYEQELQVPYYLLFYPEAQELTLHHRKRTGLYAAVRPNRAGRLAIRQLDVEMALVEGWVRFWFRGELLPLPAELLSQLQQAREEIARQEAVIEHKDAVIEQKDAVIEHKDAVIEQKDAVIERKDAAIEHKDAVIERMKAQLRALGADPDA